MYMIIRYDTGRRVEAILLSATRERMKVVVKGDQEDTLVFTLIGNRWVSEWGSEIEIESMVSDDPAAAAKIWPEAIRPLVASAVS